MQLDYYKAIDRCTSLEKTVVNQNTQISDLNNKITELKKCLYAYKQKYEKQLSDVHLAESQTKTPVIIKVVRIYYLRYYFFLIF